MIDNLVTSDRNAGYAMIQEGLILCIPIPKYIRNGSLEVKFDQVNKR